MTAPAEDPRSGGHVCDDLPFPLGRRCCGAPDSTACHQRGLCWMEGVHPDSPGFAPPAAGRGDTDSSGEAGTCRWSQRRCSEPNALCIVDCAARPAVDRAEPPEGLREAIADAVVFEWREWDVTRAEAEALTDAILALPELRRALGGPS